MTRTFETVRDCHHAYHECDCHDGVMREGQDGSLTFTGEIGRFRTLGTVTLDVPYCSTCDEPLPTNGICERCQLIHADLVEVEHLGPGKIAA